MAAIGETRGTLAGVFSGVLAVVVALGACAGSGRSTGGSAPDSTSPEIAGPPAPTTLPAWIPPALGLAGEDALVEVIGHDLTTRAFKYSFDEVQGTVTLSDGRVVDLSTVASLAASSDPTTWPALAARSFNALLAP